MNNQLNIDLNFRANTEQAQANIRNLNQSLTAIATTTAPVGTKLNEGMQQAVNSAKDLQLHLQNAFNTKTGNIDLKKLDASLKSSGQSLATLTSGLLNAGMQGEAAFMNVTRAISTAGVQINKATGLVGQFLVTLKNTAKWQLSSSLLHGFIGSIHSAISYVKDLDKSLNNIRIVTGLSAEEMAKFADSANKAAKKLSTTTTQYTNASLIYYQQGLNTKEVEERTETTIKLANVSRQSVEETANQLTAIWNNFDDGTKSLEYYADVLTKLGATTASSTDEIAGGLEKFASLGKTIGLSYEYAAAALATITANTRQSEEVVGTALKTIFARIQGLKLGETLEDGVELNKYSEALEKIGVDIIDVNGNLIAADEILDKTAEKWNTLTDAQKTATAQTVAGIRQYNQFIALMENWNNGDNDSMVANLQTAQGAEGELQNQADTYAESWEAAQKRVKTSLEEIYNELFPKESIVNLTNGLAEVLGFIADLIEGFGGFSQILLLVTSTMINKMGPAMIQALNSGIDKTQQLGTAIKEKLSSAFEKLPHSLGEAKQSFISFGVAAKEKLAHPITSIKEAFNSLGTEGPSKLGQLQTTLTKIGAEGQSAAEHIRTFNTSLKETATSPITNQQLSIEQAVNGTARLTETFKTHMADVAQVNNLQSTINDRANMLTQATREQLMSYQEQLLVLADKKAAEAETLEIIKAQKQSLLDNSMNNFDYTHPNYRERTDDRTGQVVSTELTATATISENVASKWKDIQNSIMGTSLQVRNLNGEVTYAVTGQNGIAEAASNSLSIYEKTASVNQKITDVINNQNVSIEDRKEAMRTILADAKKQGDLSKSQLKYYGQMYNSLNKSANNVGLVTRSLNNNTREAGQFAQSLGVSSTTIERINGLINQGANAEQKRNAFAQQYNNTLNNVKSTLANSIQTFTTSYGASIQMVTSGFSSVAMGINSIINAFQTLGDAEASWTSKLMAGSMALTMGYSAVASVMKIINTVIDASNAKKKVQILLQELESKKTKDKIATQAKELLMSKLAKDQDEAEALAKQKVIGAAVQEKLVDEGVIKTEQKDIVVTGLLAGSEEIETKVKEKQTLANMGYNASLGTTLAIMGAIIAIIAIYSWVTGEQKKQQQKAAEAQQNINNNLEFASKAYQRATEEANKFKEAIKNYDEGIEGLRKLKKGTEEYEEKLKEVNAQTKELIENYGLWNSYTIDSETGAYIIDRKKFGDIQQQQEQAAFDAEKNVAASRILVDHQNMGHAKGGLVLNASGISGGAVGTVLEKAAASGAIQSPVLNKVVEAIANSNEIVSANMSDEEFLNAIMDLEGLEGYEAAILMAKDQILRVKDELVSTAEAQSEYNNALKYQAAQIVGIDFKQEYGELVEKSFGGDYKAGTEDAVAKIIGESFEGNTEYSQQLEKNLAAANIGSLEATDKNDLAIADKYGGNISYEQLTREYAKTLGISEEQLANAHFTDKDWQGKLTTADGEVLLDAIYYEDMVRALKTKEIQDATLAQAKGTTITREIDGETVTLTAEEAMQAQTEALGKLVNNFNNQIDGLGDAVLTSMAKGKGEDGKYDFDLSSSFSEFSSQEEIDAYTALDSDQLLEKLGMTEEDIIAAGFESAEEFEQGFDQGLSEWTLEGHLQAMQDKADGIISQNAQKYELDEEVLKKQAKLIQQNVEGLEDNAVAAAEMAVANQRMNKGVKTLTDNWASWKKTLNGTDKTTQDYAEALVEAESAMKDILNLGDEVVIPEDFLQTPENLELLDEIANGSEEAVAQLHFNLSKAQIEAQEFNSDIAKNMKNAFAFGEFVDLSATFDTMKNNALSALSEIQAAAQQVDIGAGLNDPAKQAEWANSLNEYAMAVGMSADQMQSFLSSVGVTAQIDMVEGNPVTKKIPRTKITRSIPQITNVDLGNGQTVPAYTQYETSQIDGYDTVQEPTLVPQIKMNSEGESSAPSKPIFNRVSMGNIAPSATSGSGGGGSGGGSGGGDKNKNKKPAKPEKVKPTEKKIYEEEIDRYKIITEQIEDLEQELDNLSKIKDEAWGHDKIKAIQDEIDKIDELTDKIKQYNQRAKGFLQYDTDQAKRMGYNIVDNEITNYDEVTKRAFDDYNRDMAALDARQQANNDAKADLQNSELEEDSEERQEKEEAIEDEDKAIEEEREKVEEKYTKVLEAGDNFLESVNTLQETEQMAKDNEILKLEKNYEQMMAPIDLRIELNENDIADIEHKLERLGENDVYASAERIVTIEKQIKGYEALANVQMKGIEEAERLRQANQITQDDYMTRLKEGKEALQEIEISIYEAISQIGDELENAFDLADERLEQQFEKIDQGIELMEHYKNVVSLTEGEASYDKMNKLLKTQQQVLRDRIEADKAELTVWETRRAQLQSKINKLPEDSSAKREAEEALQVILEKEADAKAQLMSDIEQLGEYAREIFENSIEQIVKDFEEKTFGGSLEGVIESIEMRNAKQEELLTTTNKIYETNKLIRSVEKDIEATTNNRAKQAYLEFQNKVKQKQEQNKLTQFELDLLTAEYEMTKAQIALKEAQDAKDTVRLTRDSEGNYGYVYTANEDKIADAEQALDDATNNYYNTALEGAQNYQDQIYEHIQEWEEKVKEVYLDQTLSEEEKNKKIKEINDTYDTLITQDKELFYMAKKEMEESSYLHQADYDLMGIESAENWFVNCDGFLEELENAQDEYDKNTEEVAKHTEENFGDMETAIDNTAEASEDLKKIIVEELAPELKTTLKKAIDEATLSWLKQIEALKEVIRLTNEAMGKTQQAQELKASDDYAQSIIDEFEKGDEADLDYIEKLAQERDKKTGGIDLTDYSKILERDDLTDAQRKGYEYLKNRKINTLKNTNYDQLLYDYLFNQKGKIDDSYAQNILAMRQLKIDLGYAGKDVLSNKELISKYTEPQPTEDKETKKSAVHHLFTTINSTLGSLFKDTEEATKPSLSVGSQIEVKPGTKWYADSNGGGSSGTAKSGTITKISEKGSHSYLIDNSGWIKKSDIVGYDTGGYTGVWGPEGKLALLHEKEIVLNKQDTENLLAATTILREISDILDQNALMASLGAFNLKAMTVNSPADQVLQQEVTIHADFPNVSDHNEIEIAIDNLINAASQHAFKV